MNPNPEPRQAAFQAAEQVLQKIYGDDLNGCTVTLNSIAAIIDDAVKHAAAPDHELLDLYEKVIEAIGLLSTPPKPDQVADLEQLRVLLGERLDAIRAVTTKTAETVARARGRPSID